MRRWVSVKPLYIGSAAVCLLAGGGMLLFPHVFAGAVFFVAGGVCLLYGLLRIVGYFSSDLYNLAFQFGLSTGIVSILLGAVLFCSPGKDVLFLQSIAGLFLVVLGALKLPSVREAKKFGLQKWWLLCVFAAIGIALGIGLMVWPFSDLWQLTRVLGGVLVVCEAQEVFDIVYTVKFQ